jgi:hypothetical protein
MSKTHRQNSSGRSRAVYTRREGRFSFPIRLLCDKAYLLSDLRQIMGEYWSTI